MENNKTIFFDFDGTIADTLSRVISLYNQIAIKSNFRIVNADNLPELRNKKPFDILKDLHVPLRKLPFVAGRIRQQLKAHLSEILVFNGIKDTLIKIKSMNHKIGIISTNKIGNIRLFINSNEIDYFDFIFSCKKVFGKHKTIEEAIKKFRLNKNSVIYVADEIRDIDACKKTGIKIISVCWGYNDEGSLKRENPGFTAEKPEDILRLLK